MGALVGAMYAMGSSPEQIRAIGNELDWDKALSGPPSFNELSSGGRKINERIHRISSWVLARRSSCERS